MGFKIVAKCPKCGTKGFVICENCKSHDTWVGETDYSVICTCGMHNQGAKCSCGISVFRQFYSKYTIWDQIFTAQKQVERLSINYDTNSAYVKELLAKAGTKQSSTTKELLANAEKKQSSTNYESSPSYVKELLAIAEEKKNKENLLKEQFTSKLKLKYLFFFLAIYFLIDFTGSLISSKIVIAEIFGFYNFFQAIFISIFLIAAMHYVLTTEKRAKIALVIWSIFFILNTKEKFNKATMQNTAKTTNTNIIEGSSNIPASDLVSENQVKLSASVGKDEKTAAESTIKLENQKRGYDIAKYIIGLLKDGRVLDASEYCYLRHEDVPYNCMNKGCSTLVDAMLNFGQIYKEGKILKPAEMRAFESTFKQAVNLLMLGLSEAKLASMPPQDKLLNQMTANQIAKNFTQLIASDDEAGAVAYAHKILKSVPLDCINEACKYLYDAFAIMSKLYVEQRKATKTERDLFDQYIIKYAELELKLAGELEKH